MTSKHVIPTWSLSVLGGLAVTVSLSDMPLPWKAGLVITLSLMPVVAIWTRDLWSGGLRTLWPRPPIKSCTTPPMTAGGWVQVDSLSMAASMTPCSPRPSWTKTDSPSASTPSASSTSKKSRVSRASSRPQPISVSTLKKSSGSSRRCTLVSTPNKTRH